jgi:hypothetical protein
MNLRDLFPEAVVNQETGQGPEWLTLPLDGQFIHFPLETLSQREQALLNLQESQPALQSSVQDVWHQFLVQKKGGLPTKLERVQLLYLEHGIPLSSDLLDLFYGLLPHLTALVELHATRTLLVLDQTIPFEVEALIQDILPAVESDFGTKLTIFFGNSWTKLQAEELRQVFDSEYQLFSDFVPLKGSEQTISFAKMALWARSGQLNLGVIPEKIRHYIDESKDMVDIIEAMWTSQTNLVQTAQKLFMHRNSLQYKLDKFHSLSGLNLKNLDDLAFCHLLMLNG